MGQGTGRYRARARAWLAVATALAVATLGATATAGSAHAAGGGGPGDQVGGSAANGQIAVHVTLSGSAVGNGGTTSSGGSGGGGVTTVYTPPACYWDSLGGAYTGASMNAMLQSTPQRWFVGSEANYLPSQQEVERHKGDDGVWYTIAPGPNSDIVTQGSGYNWDDITSRCMSRMRGAAGPGANGGNAGYIFVPAGSAPPAPQPAPPTPEQLRDAAMAALTLPVPALRRNPVNMTLVNLPTWFWVPAGDFRDWVVSATVYATPASMTVSSAGGSSDACNPASSTRAWSSGADDRAGCTISFFHSSVGQPGLAFDTAGTTTYTTRWTSTVAGAAGPAGPLADLFRTGDTQVPVAESQALVSGTR